MVATSGSSLMKTNAVQTLIDDFCSRPSSRQATFEGWILSSEKIEQGRHGARPPSASATPTAAPYLKGRSPRERRQRPAFYAGGEMQWFEGKRIDNPNTHGTGCTLSERHRVEHRQGATRSASPSRGRRVHLKRAVGRCCPRHVSLVPELGSSAEHQRWHLTLLKRRQTISGRRQATPFDARHYQNAGSVIRFMQ